MDQATVHHASCGCGALSVVAHGEPARVLLCSCTTCQKRTGSALGITALWPQDSVVVTGPSTKWVRAGQGGRVIDQHFCATCGTTLWWRGDFAPGMTCVAGGCFEETDFLDPGHAYWVSRRPAWFANCDRIASSETQG